MSRQNRVTPFGDLFAIPERGTFMGNRGVLHDAEGRIRRAWQAVVVGAGFIGLELVENLLHGGITTTAVELQDQVLLPFDKEMTTPLAEHLAAKSVSLLLGQSAHGDLFS
jgi:NADPH-dependent 2,4-dienoyl-CoA reductase/sulfur reductase-like enzyme